MPTQPSSHDSSVVSYLTMRKAIGWLGMLLPVLLLTGNIILNYTDIFNNKLFFKIAENYHYASPGSFKSSVSHYYYSTMGELFTGILFTVSLFMICYNGHPLRKGDKGFSDNTMTNLAGIFALGVAIFPTSSDDFIQDNLRNYLSSDFIGYVHYFFAASFFIVLAFLCIINFRRAQQQNLFGTGPDDPFYKKCGITMLICLALVPLFAMYLEPKYQWLRNINSTFILETIALFAFGLSWLKKGQADFQYLPRKAGLVK